METRSWVMPQGLARRKAGGRPLCRENARLLRRLEHAEAIIDIQKKVAALLGIPLATLPDNGDEP
jgi:hypothetical protein